METRRSLNTITVTACCLLVLIIFTIDALTSLGAAVNVIYPLLVLLTLWLPGHRATFALAGLATLLIGAGHFLSAHNNLDSSAAERGIVLFSIWGAAIIVFSYKRHCNAFKRSLINREAKTKIHADNLSQEIEIRERAEEALRENNERFLTLARIAPVGIYYTDSEGDVAYGNETFNKISGLDTTQAESYGWADAVHPEDRFRALAQWREAAKTREPTRVEFRFQRLDGTISWVIGQMASRQADNGEISGYVGTITDVTEYKQAEEALRRITAEQEMILENAHIGIVFMKGGLCQRMNSYAQNLFGWELSEILGSNSEKFFASHEDFEQAWAEAGELFSQGKPYQREGFMKRKDGSLFWCRNLGIMVDPQDPELGEIWLAEDITERKEAEEKLLEQAQILDQIQDGVIVMDFDGCITGWHAGAEKVTGYTASEVLGQHFAHLHIEKDNDFIATNVLEPIREIEAIELETRLRKRSGELFIAQISYSLARNNEGEPIGIMANTRDITKRKRAEEELKTSESRLAQA